MDSRDAAFGPPPARLRAAPSRRRVCPPPARLRASPTPPQGGSDYCCSLQGFSYSPQVIPPLNSPRTSLQTLEYHSPLEGESQKPEPNGEGFCGGGVAQGEPRARSCAPSRVSSGQPTGDGFCGGRVAQGEPRARSCAPSRVCTGQPTGEGRWGVGRTPHSQVQRRADSPTKKGVWKTQTPFRNGTFVPTGGFRRWLSASCRRDLSPRSSSAGPPEPGAP